MSFFSWDHQWELSLSSKTLQKCPPATPQTFYEFINSQFPQEIQSPHFLERISRKSISKNYLAWPWVWNTGMIAFMWMDCQQLIWLSTSVSNIFLLYLRTFWIINALNFSWKKAFFEVNEVSEKICWLENVQNLWQQFGALCVKINCDHDYEFLDA